MTLSFLEGALARFEFSSPSQSQSHAHQHSTEDGQSPCSEIIHSCCHLNLFLNMQALALESFLPGTTLFSDFIQNLKPSPVLDGPFQPPRA